MEVTVNVGGLLQYLVLGWHPPDDKATVIGISMVAFLSARDPAHVFLDEAVWHDAAYIKGASIQSEWPRWRVDEEFLHKMLIKARGDLELEKEALTLYLIVRQYGGSAWEGSVPEDQERA